MSDVRWNSVVSCVAGAEGLEVVERQPDGTLGAARNVPYSMPVAVRQKLVLGALHTYFVESVVLKQTNAGGAAFAVAPPLPTAIMFSTPEHVALNVVQGAQAEAPSHVCYRLWKSDVSKETYFQTMDVSVALKHTLVWDGCSKFPGQPPVYPPQQRY